MPVEIIGMIGTHNVSEMHGPNADLIGGSVDVPLVRRFAQAHERSGFDRVLIGYSSTAADSFMVAAYSATITERLSFLIAHRPGFVAPTLAARTAATLDHFSGGRVALHFITGGSEAEQQADGDRLPKDARYRRTGEYIEVMKRVWSSESPFDFDGEFYQLRRAFSEVKPLQRPRVPIYFGGASAAAIPVGAEHCDVYMMWGEPIAAVRERMAEVQQAAEAFGRRVRFSVSTRPILGRTEEKAWERARDILGRILHVRGPATPPEPSTVESVGSQRLLEAAEQGEVLDERLWTPIAAATGAGGNTTALVGTPEQVAEALLAYYDAGVTTLLIRGFEPLEDAVDYGRELVPLIRSEVARRDRAAVHATV